MDACFHDTGRGTLGQHQGNEAGPRANIKDRHGILHRCPGPQQYTIGPNFKCRSVLLYQELLELKIILRHQ